MSDRFFRHRLTLITLIWSPLRFEFMKKRKKYWLAPIIILLILMIFLIIFTETVGPFIYPLI